MRGRDSDQRRRAGSPGGGFGGVLFAVLASVLTAATFSACSEAGLTSVEGEDPPGAAADTREVVVPVSEFGFWKDSTFRGFAIPSTVPRILAAQDSTFQSRALIRFESVPDTVIIDAQLLPVDSVGEIMVRFGVDTARSALAGDSTTVSVFTLGRHFDPREAEWDQAAAGAPWPPGGALARRLGRSRVPSTVDTFTVRVGANSDSLYRSWKAAGSPPSMAVVVNGPSNRLLLRNAVLEFRARPPEQDTLAPTTSVVEERTYIYHPPQPDPGNRLRLGGIPSSRVYVTFRPPDSVGGVPLRGAQINRADLLFEPVGSVSSFFRPRGALNGVVVELLADPFELGAKTPVGGAIAGGQVFTLDPDSAAAGRPLAVNVTGLFSTWSRLPPDSTTQFRIGLRPIPDGGQFGFWDFGSIRADSAALRPRVRILFTPPTSFSLP